MDIEKLKNIVQDCNINFLFGSGMSASYLSVLGSIEVLLTDANEVEDERQKKIIKSSLYKLYFDGVIKKNIKILSNDVATRPLMNSYKNFLKYLIELF
jgi:general stress protein 26